MISLLISFERLVHPRRTTFRPNPSSGERRGIR